MNIGQWFQEHRQQLKKFALVGLSAAVINLGAMVFLVEVLDFKTDWLKNIANFLSIEISVVYNFIFSRRWTWKHRPQKYGRQLAAQFCSFNLAQGLGILLRVALFALLDKFGVHYLLNVTIGMALAAAVNYALCDKLVFRKVDEEELQ